MTVKNFIPTIWSARLLANLDKKLVYANVVNHDYEGEIKNLGDKVKINQIGPIAVKDYLTGEGGVDSNIAYKNYPELIKCAGLNGYKKISKWNRKDNNKWEYIKDGKAAIGWLEYNNKWYYFEKEDDKGWMYTGWLEYNSNWFYFNPDGSMHTGWLEYKNKDGKVNHFYFDKKGYMLLGEQTINGKKYKFNESGYLIS